MSGEGPADPSEVGRELLASDLAEGMIVFIDPPQPAGRPRVMFTMHVARVTDELVIFYSGVQRANVVNFKTADGLADGKGRVVRVFEYLGEP